MYVVYCGTAGVAATLAEGNKFYTHTVSQINTFRKVARMFIFLVVLKITSSMYYKIYVTKEVFLEAYNDTCT